MAGIHLQSASPLSSNSSQQSLIEDEEALQNSSETTFDPDKMAEVPIKLDAEAQLANAMESVLPNTPASRKVPRLVTSTRQGSIGAALPWKVDETGSPYTPISQGRKASFAPPPPKAGSYRPTAAGSPAPSSPYSSSPFTPLSASSANHLLDLSNPPNYTQNSRASFSDRSTTYYDQNSTPFYQNSVSSSLGSPMTPSRRGLGILDNDPNIYLRGEGDADEDTMWDTAAKWAKAAGKRLSAGEQQIWKMVSEVVTGEVDR